MNNTDNSITRTEENIIENALQNDYNIFPNMNDYDIISQTINNSDITIESYDIIVKNITWNNSRNTWSNNINKYTYNLHYYRENSDMSGIIVGIEPGYETTITNIRNGSYKLYWTARTKLYPYMLIQSQETELVVVDTQPPVIITNSINTFTPEESIVPYIKIKKVNDFKYIIILYTNTDKNNNIIEIQENGGNSLQIQNSFTKPKLMAMI